MAQNTEPMHWRDRAIEASEAISDGFEVLKAYGARIAEWVLFFCLVANILEIFPLPEPFASVFGNIVLGIQSVTLDIAGFGLASMGDHARRREDLAAARKAGTMGWTLIGVMILTVSLVTLAIIVPGTKPTVDIIEKVLILVRVIVTVLYGHIVHSLRNAGTEFDNRVQALERDLSGVQAQLEAKQQEVSSVQSQLSSVQRALSILREELDTAKQEVSSGQRRLEAEQQRASSLEEELLTGQGDTGQVRRDLAAVKLEAEGLQMRLSAKVREVAEMQADLSNVVNLRREANAAQLASEELRRQLDGKGRELETVQSHLSTEQRTVSSLRRELSSVQSSQVSTGQSECVSTGQKNGGSGQVRQGDTGQQKVAQLDSRRINPREYALAVQQLMAEEKLAGREISGREISRRLGASPTTANEWKKFFDEGKKLEDVFPDLRVVNE